ncbi:MAG: chemotaxis-specific protein-glutamate methyltransferase CheB [Pseudomonadota bacterium]
MASRPDAARPVARARNDSRNVLVVDDSAVARLIVQRVINETDRFFVAGHAASAEDALDQLMRTSVDLVVLDIAMPGMNGIEAIPHIIRKSGNAPILIVSSHCREGAELSVRAMAMGASDLILKPESRAENEQFASALRAAMIRLTEGRAEPSPPLVGPNGTDTAGAAATTQIHRPVKCLAIGASTGGIHAVSQLFAALPRDLAIPILVTQHLPADFIVYFAKQLQVTAGRRVMPARDGQRVSNTDVLIAPGDAHLTVVRGDGDLYVSFDRAPASNGFCPSVDPMLSSVAEVFGDDAIGVVLTGMGRDGVLGAAELADAGGELLVQDSESSVIWGMPGAVANQGIANLVAPPADIADHIARRAKAFGCS